jgi:signal transduction histidine kinase
VSIAGADLQLQYLNQAGYSFFDLPHDTQINKSNVFQFLPEWVIHLFQESILPEVKKHGLWLGEAAVIDGKGVEVPVSQIVLGHFDAQGNLSRLSTNFRDIRYIKEFEHRLRDKELEVQEQQSHFITNELHDRVGQNLTVLNLNLTLLSKRAEQGKQPITRQDIETPLQLVEETMASIRNIMSEIRPPALDDYGIFVAIRNSAAQFSNRTGINIFVDGRSLEPRLPSQYEIALFRIYQEALTNIIKHAKATHIVVKLMEKHNRISLAILDNGIGFETNKVQLPKTHDGWGIPSMITRAKDMGAVLTIDSEPGKGTQIRVELERPQ